MKDHLGNIRATVSDIRLSDLSSSGLSSFKVDVPELFKQSNYGSNIHVIYFGGAVGVESYFGGAIYQGNSAPLLK